MSLSCAENVMESGGHYSRSMQVRCAHKSAIARAAARNHGGLGAAIFGLTIHDCKWELSVAASSLRIGQFWGIMLWCSFGGICPFV